MCVSFCVSVFVKDGAGSGESDTERHRERGRESEDRGGRRGTPPESKQRQQAAAPSLVTEAP